MLGKPRQSGFHFDTTKEGFSQLRFSVGQLRRSLLAKVQPLSMCPDLGTMPPYGQQPAALLP